MQLRAGETTDGKAVTTTTEETPEYKNWIELGIGGTIVNGDNAQFEQEHRLPGDTAYGGIQDLHFEGPLGKDGLFSVDGHAHLGHQRLRHNSAVVEAKARLHQGRFY